MSVMTGTLTGRRGVAPPAGGSWVLRSEKVQSWHWDWLAVVYVR